MGGDYYDRDVVSYDTTITTTSTTEIGAKQVHSSLNPLRWAEDNLVSEVKNPIVFALDVTGSMGEWAKIIYDKMPMFYGQIMMQKYLEEPAISFCAIGDHTSEGEDTPIQISEFGQGKAIDQLISKLVLLKSGNGNEKESYELASYFYDTNVDLFNADYGFFFVTGDEGFFPSIDGNIVLKIYGKGTKQATLDSTEVWHKLMQKFNVFHVHKPYCSANYESKIHNQWVQTIGEERVLDIITPKACIDVILGAIALTSGRTLNEYVNDMKSRGQDNARIQEVTRALTKYAKKLETKEIVPVKIKSVQMNFNQNDFVNNSSINNVQKIKVDEKELSEALANFENLLLEDIDEETADYWSSLKALKKKSTNLPNEFLCPLTKEIVLDPVMTTDGHSFERKAIELWLEIHDNSPISGEVLTSKMLLPNFALKQLIKDYYQSSN